MNASFHCLNRTKSAQEEQISARQNQGMRGEGKGIDERQEAVAYDDTL